MLFGHLPLFGLNMNRFLHNSRKECPRLLQLPSSGQLYPPGEHDVVLQPSTAQPQPSTAQHQQGRHDVLLALQESCLQHFAHARPTVFHLKKIMDTAEELLFSEPTMVTDAHAHAHTHDDAHAHIHEDAHDDARALAHTLQIKALLSEIAADRLEKSCRPSDMHMIDDGPVSRFVESFDLEDPPNDPALRDLANLRTAREYHDGLVTSRGRCLPLRGRLLLLVAALILGICVVVGGLVAASGGRPSAPGGSSPLSAGDGGSAPGGSSPLAAGEDAVLPGNTSSGATASPEKVLFWEDLVGRFVLPWEVFLGDLVGIRVEVSKTLSSELGRGTIRTEVLLCI